LISRAIYLNSIGKIQNAIQSKHVPKYSSTKLLKVSKLIFRSETLSEQGERPSSRLLRPHSKTTLELNSKKVELNWPKKFLSVFVRFFFALTAELQVRKFEFVRLSRGRATDKPISGKISLELNSKLKFAVRIRPLANYVFVFFL